MTTIPFLAAAVILFPSLAGRIAARHSNFNRGELITLYFYSALMLTWVLIAAVAGYRGIWIHEEFLGWLPGIWLPLVPVAIVLLPLLLPDVRNRILRVGQSTPWSWFAAVQATRMSAIGTAIKTYRGEFPEMVEYLLGLPDLCYGLSALWVIRLASQNKLTKTSWCVWNAIGFAIIVPWGMMVINMSLPGPITVFDDKPSFLVALEFPLSLAPTAIVPWLVVFNLWAISSTLLPNEPADSFGANG